MGSADGKVLGAILGNIYGITLGTNLGSLYGRFDGYDDINIEGLLLGYSLRYTDGKVLVSN